jgi:RNA polymerase sigma-70 factor (ECF subfamily)
VGRSPAVLSANTLVSRASHREPLDVPDPDDVSALVLRAQRGDRAAFSLLATRFARAVYAVALAHLARPSDAEDATQDTLLLALERIDQCSDRERFRPWLLQIARNHARHLLAKRKHRDVTADERSDAEGPVDPPGQERSLARRELTKALRTLTEPQREALLLHDLEGWSHSEIASALSITEEACRQHVSRARRALRAALDPANERETP